MKLDSKPNIQQLKSLLAAADDNEAHHIIWVNKVGEVFVTPLPEDMNPVGFEKSTPDMLMRYETCQMGNAYVGLSAAQDTTYVQRLYNSLVKEWSEASPESAVMYIDSF